MKNILCYANNLVANVARSIRYIGNTKLHLFPALIDYGFQSHVEEK